MRKFLPIVMCAVILSTTVSAQKYVESPKFQGYATIGTVFLGTGVDVLWRGDVNLSVGARLNDNLYLGVETGLGYLDSGSVYGYDYFMGYIPIALNTHLMLPLSAKCAPFLNVALGGYLGVGDEGSDGFYMQLGVGFDYQRFTFGIGYTGFGDHGMTNAGYIKIGVKFGGKTW